MLYYMIRFVKFLRRQFKFRNWDLIFFFPNEAGFVLCMEITADIFSVLGKKRKKSHPNAQDSGGRHVLNKKFCESKIPWYQSI